MFQSSLGDVQVVSPPVSQLRFVNAVHNMAATYLSISPHQLVFLLIAFLFVGCESTMVRQVHYYEKVGDLASASQYLEAELLRRPDNSEARYLLGKVLFKEQAFTEGRAAFDQVESQTARFSESIQYILESRYRDELQLGIDAIEAANYPQAVTHLTYATQIRPEYNPGHRMLGYAQTQVGQLSDAAMAYQRAVMLEPADFESWQNLSEIAFVDADFEASREYATKALALDPQSQVAQRRLAHAHVNLREHEQATAAFKQLLNMDTGVEDVRDFAYFLYNIGSYDLALPHLELLAEGEMASVELLKTLGDTYAGLQQFKKVVQVNERILAKEPQDRTAIGNLISAHEKLGQFDQAKEWQAELTRLGGEM